MTSQLQDIYQISNIWKLFTSNTRKKEKLDYILEPLQAMTQLCFLAFCPIGSKLTIHDNLLMIQQPGMAQGLIRYFNEDTKDDLYYLFNVFRRFLTYYKHLEEQKNTQYNKLYEIIIELATKGLDKLIQTYTDSNKISVLHTLQMYKIMLQKRDFFDNENINNQPSMGSTTQPIAIRSKLYNDGTNIDNIFCNIVNIYGREEYAITLNILLLSKKNPSNIENYICSCNCIMKPNNDKIKKWINDNIAL
jgi:hypothetical protein